jgi:excisionase family DNA binding protein
VEDVLERLAGVLERLEGALERPTVVREWFSIEEAAFATGLSKDHVRRAVISGALTASDLGTPDRPLYRISRNNLLRWMQERERPRRAR